MHIVTSPVFFPTFADLVAWYDRHHRTTLEVWIGFHKRASGKPSVTWPESVDAALCFGWIDGVRKSIDETRYMIRFTPRKAKSNWSVVNIERARALTEQGLMRPEGLAAFEARGDDRVATYSYEQRKAPEFSAAEARAFRAHKAAWKWFSTQAPSYQRVATFWVVSAKLGATRKRRLETLIDDSAHGRDLAAVGRRPKKR
jgi:uncharacterized protein YdeI (YjbR/CyaY-like superfamily)